nr:hypothetical protein [Tanacetum cinerariifolium]
MGGGVSHRGGGIPRKQRSINEDDQSGSSMNKLRTINGMVVRSRGRRDGSKSRMCLGGIRPIRFGVSCNPVR